MYLAEKIKMLKLAKDFFYILLKWGQIKNSCVYWNMSGKNGTIGHDFFFSTRTTHMHILALTMLHLLSLLKDKGSKRTD